MFQLLPGDGLRAARLFRINAAVTGFDFYSLLQRHFRSQRDGYVQWLSRTRHEVVVGIVKSRGRGAEGISSAVNRGKSENSLRVGRCAADFASPFTLQNNGGLGNGLARRVVNRSFNHSLGGRTRGKQDPCQ